MAIRDIIEQARERLSAGIPQGNGPITAGPIGAKEVGEAAETLRKYKDGKANLERRIVENEQWYKMRHWDQIRGDKSNGDPEPASAWLFNSLANKHADAMDNYPEPNVLPREEGDKADAETLSNILPVVLEHNEFEQTYNDTWWYKLKNGTGVYGVFWNKKLEDGLGDIDIRQIDILNIFWQPGIKRIQDSRNIFTVELMDNELLEQQYPQLKGRLGGVTIDVAEYQYDDTVVTTDKSAVVDWYYKQTMSFDDGTSKELLHFCKFVGETVLFASENDPQYQQRGLYDHSDYPFVFDTLFPVEGTPCGFGYIDVMRDPQMYIDKLNQIIITNAYDLGNPRYFASDGADINEEEFLDRKKKIVHVAGRIDDTQIKAIEVRPIDSSVVNHLTQKVEELKETSGNRDFSQGGTTSGVTAASAIAALQEAGSKLSRDMIKSSYRAFTRINYICIELIRQFYDEPRTFRIEGQSGMNFVAYSNQNIRPQEQGNDFGLDMGYRRPVFDIKITSQKASPFSKIAQNELAKELYGLGAFNPQLTQQTSIMLEMMDFEGKDMVMQKIAQNSEMIQTLLNLATIVDAQNGGNIAEQLAIQYGVQPPTPQVQSTGSTVQTNPLGDAVRVSNNNTSTKAQERASNIAEPR